MIVAGLVPALNCAMACTISEAGRPARPATAEPATGLPFVPWHIEQPPAIDCTPLGVRLAGAKLGVGGAGCCANARPAAAAARPARVLATVLFMGFSVRGWA